MLCAAGVRIGSSSGPVARGGRQQKGVGEGPGKGEVVEAQVDGRGGAGFSRDGDTAAVGRLEQSKSKIATEFEVEQG